MEQGLASTKAPPKISAPRSGTKKYDGNAPLNGHESTKNRNERISSRPATVSMVAADRQTDDRVEHIRSNPPWLKNGITSNLQCELNPLFIAERQQLLRPNLRIETNLPRRMASFTTAPAYFFDTIQLLRHQEELVLYTQHVAIDGVEHEYIGQFLKEEYQQESENYPHTPPAFDTDASIWGARIVYNAAQLLLNRNQPESEFAQLLPEFEGQQNASTWLSADLCLRFLPGILQIAKAIDPDDTLATHLRTLLQRWHFSGLGDVAIKPPFELELMVGHPCLKQLYVDRILQSGRSDLADLPLLRDAIQTAAGWEYDTWRQNATH